MGEVNDRQAPVHAQVDGQEQQGLGEYVHLSTEKLSN